jgi:hypothetical protein
MISLLSVWANNVGVPIGFGLLMMLGYCVPSGPYLAAVGTDGLWGTGWAVFAAFVTWTPTNLLAVTVLSCYIFIAMSTKMRNEKVDILDTWHDASLRGVVVWFTTLTGAGWLDFAQVFEATNESYVRLWCLVVGAGLALSIPTKEVVAKTLRIQ